MDISACMKRNFPYKGKFEFVINDVNTIVVVSVRAAQLESFGNKMFL